MKGTGVVRVTPYQMTCSWCRDAIMPFGDFVYWHKLIHTMSGHHYDVVPVHPKCWKEINGEKGRKWKKTFYKKSSDALNVAKVNLHYIGSKMKREKR